MTSGLALQRRSRSDWALNLPYGEWRTADGRVVLFNRHYRPLWELRPDHSIAKADPNEWIAWETQRWFYDDSVPEAGKRAAAEAALARFAAEGVRALLGPPRHRKQHADGAA